MNVDTNVYVQTEVTTVEPLYNGHHWKPTLILVPYI